MAASATVPDSSLIFPGRSADFVNYTVAKNWIGGAWRDADGGKTMDVLNPRHAKAMGQVVLSTKADVEAAVEAAKKAQPGWKATPIKERAQVLFKLKHLIEENIDELSWLVTHENGKTYDESKASIMKGVECIEMGCALQNMVAGGQMEVSRGVNCEVTYEPVGVCAGIVPFNFPIMVPMWMLPQALLAGNAFILKPSEQVPFTAMRVAMLLKEAGLPDGVFNTVNGARDAVEGIVDAPDIKAIGFVGSTRVAKIVYGRGSALGKKMLCLGGAKNHLVVAPDADPELTAQNVVASAFGCAGQRCMAASVMVAVGDVQHIIDKIADHANKMQLGKDMGSIISEQAVERMRKYVDEAEKMGAKIVVDGRGQTVDGSDGYWFGPTILDNVDGSMPAGCDEIFGPVLSIRRTKTLDEAIAIENESPYGNAAAIYTTSGNVAQYAIERFEAGMCAVNIGVPVPREPFSFGGWNDSKFGGGDITGMDGYRFWTRPKKVTTKWAIQKDQNWMS